MDFINFSTGSNSELYRLFRVFPFEEDRSSNALCILNNDTLRNPTFLRIPVCSARRIQPRRKETKRTKLHNNLSRRRTGRYSSTGRSCCLKRQSENQRRLCPASRPAILCCSKWRRMSFPCRIWMIQDTRRNLSRAKTFSS